MTIVAYIKVTIVGATGIHSAKVNGDFEATDDMSLRGTLYRKKGDADTWLVYHFAIKKWMVQKTSAKGTEDGWAFLQCNSLCLPNSRSNPWSVWCKGALYGERLQEQPSVSVSIDATAQEIAAANKWLGY